MFPNIKITTNPIFSLILPKRICAHTFIFTFLNYLVIYLAFMKLYLKSFLFKDVLGTFTIIAKHIFILGFVMMFMLQICLIHTQTYTGIYMYSHTYTQTYVTSFLLWSFFITLCVIIILEYFCYLGMYLVL